MKKDLVVVLLIFIITSVFWRGAFFNFFAQDDFIFIQHFSQNSLVTDARNVFGPPAVTHWRPFHNLYFLIAGNLFGKNFALYHLLTLFIHITAGFFVFKVGQILTKSNFAALSAAIFYTVHPAHFVSLFWIAGGATVIGFFFLIASFYGYLLGKKIISLILFTLALLASEAMIVGIVIFGLDILLRRAIPNVKFLIQITTITTVFVIVRFGFLTPTVTFNVYPMELSFKTLEAIKYYLLRIAGFAESSGDLVISILLLVWLAVVAVLLVKRILERKNIYLMFSLLVIITGLFPFILIPSHLSPHYMNLSIWGLSMALALAFKRSASVLTAVILAVFLIVTLVNINKTQENNWVVKRSNLARAILADVETKKLADGSTIIFSDTDLASSKETYIALGEGRAIDFWFRDKNYKTCFTFLEDCAR